MSADRTHSPDSAPLAAGVESAVAECAGGLTVNVRVIPRAGASRIAGMRNGAVLVRLAAAPVEGAANRALVSLLARALHVAPQTITIAAGHRTRDKRVSISSADPPALKTVLHRLLRAG